MSPIIPSRYGHPKYNIFPQKTRATSLGGFKTNQRGTPGTDSKSRRKQRVEESKITVQPTEDEDADNFFSKQLAAARFQRNHRLINVLFSDVVVELEQPSDNDKLQACKRKKTLGDCQKKIDDEIVEITEKFQTKKARIVEEGKRFAAKLTELIANSKKEITTAKVAQQEASQRQQAKAVADGRLESANKRIKLDHKTTSDLPIDEQHRKEVRLVLDELIDSIANTI